MKAFHGKTAVKNKYLERVKAHAKADEIIKGAYWEEGKGCAVGCTIHSASHKAYEIELGIPQIIARLEDRIFEGLPLNLAKTWPMKFLKAIRVGADLSRVWDEFASCLLTDPVWGVIQYARNELQIETIQRVSDLYEAKLAGLEVDAQDFRAAAYAADASYAAYTAYTAAYAATVASASASAARAAGDAKEKAYVFQSEMLLEILRKS